MSDVVRFLATWSLLHDGADEAWQAALARAAAGEAAGADGEAFAEGEPFADALAALVEREKRRLKATLTAGEGPSELASADLAEALRELRFEVADVRARMETLQASIDVLLERSER